MELNVLGKFWNLIELYNGYDGMEQLGAELLETCSGPCSSRHSQATVGPLLS